MEKYNFLLNKHNTQEEFLKNLNTHLKKRKINIDILKNNKKELSNYFKIIIESENLNALAVFNTLNINSSYLEYSLYSVINKISQFQNYKDFLILLSTMNFFNKQNINENTCLLSSFIGKKDFFIDDLVELGFPKTLIGSNNYMTYLLRDNNYNKINYLIKNNYNYSLDSFLGAERGSCNSRKKLQDKIKCTYLILDYSIDEQEKIHKYALEFLYVILKSSFSTKENIEEYIQKYKLEIPVSMFNKYYNESYIDNIDNNYIDKFNCIYNNLNINKKNENLDIYIVEKLEKIYKNKNIEAIEYLLSQNINFSKHILSFIKKQIPNFLEQGKTKEMEMIKNHFPELMENKEYDIIAANSLNKFMKNYILTNSTISHSFFFKYTNFIIDYYFTKSCINQEINSMYHKESTLFILACKDNNNKLAQALSKNYHFDIGKNMVLLIKKEKDSFGINGAMYKIKKIKLDSKLNILDSDFYKQNFVMIKEDTEKAISLVNSSIEKNILSSNITNIDNKIHNNKRL